jgi:hypothetical protein
VLDSAPIVNFGDVAFVERSRRMRFKRKDHRGDARIKFDRRIALNVIPIEFAPCKS